MTRSDTEITSALSEAEVAGLEKRERKSNQPHDVNHTVQHSLCARKPHGALSSPRRAISSNGLWGDGG